MIFFDYLYYLCCRFYRRYKDDQDLDTWRISGGIISTGITWLFILSTLSSLTIFLKINIDNYYGVLTIGIFALLLFLLILSAIRYNKFTSYKEIALKVEDYSPTKIWVLDISVVLYIILGLPLYIVMIFLHKNLGLI